MDDRGRLPEWRSVLAVIAHPDDESFGLGAILSAFADQGAQSAVLCMTRGEASTLHGVAGDLGEIREGELAAAAVGHRLADIDLVVPVDRGRQFEAVRHHASQALPTSAL